MRLLSNECKLTWSNKSPWFGGSYFKTWKKWNQNSSWISNFLFGSGTNPDDFLRILVLCQFVSYLSIFIWSLTELTKTPRSRWCDGFLQSVLNGSYQVKPNHLLSLSTAVFPRVPSKKLDFLKYLTGRGALIANFYATGAWVSKVIFYERDTTVSQDKWMIASVNQM